MVLLFVIHALALSTAKPPWYDEWFTAIFARLRQPAAIAQAVRDAADPIPPAFYILEGSLSGYIPIEVIALRLPAVVGAAGAAASLFAFLKPSLGGLSALIGTTFLCLTVAFTTFAAEARPYGLLLGCISAAALTWKSAHKSWTSFVAFACCLTLASAIHYYAVFALFAFLLAEAWLTLRYRSPRVGPLVSLCVAVVPLIFQWPFLNEAREVFMPNFWGKSNPGVLMAIYQDLVPRFWILIPALSVLLLLETLVCRRILPEPTSTSRRLRCHRKFDDTDSHQSIVLAVCLSFLMPVGAVTATWLMHGGFSPRYVLPAVLGVAISFAFFSTKLSLVSRLALLLLFCLSAAVDCANSVRRAWTANTGSGRLGAAQYISSLELPGKRYELPLVLGNAGMFLEASIQSPLELRKRVFFVADRRHAVKITGTDSVDVGLLRLRRVAPLNVIDYEIFRRQYARFYVLSAGNRFEWLVDQLTLDGCQLSLIRSERPWKLFRSECNVPRG